jgi:hypothetical protein
MATNFPVSASGAPLVPLRLELAVQGWRECMQAVAQGFASLDRGIVLCDICGCELERGTGHAVNCLTLLARRMIEIDTALRPAGRAREVTQLPLSEVNIDAIHAIREATSAPLPTLASGER